MMNPLDAALILMLLLSVSQAAEPEHWAFRQLKTPGPPGVSGDAAANGGQPVDRFIQSKLDAIGLRIGPAASRRTLIRRLSLDLLGLPPSPTEIDAYVADESPNADERLVERLLASPHYGERWGKYWLDVAGYADSNGYFNADTDRPLAYRYRDYVVRSLNADKPFDVFVREQLAGDELAGFDPQKDAAQATAAQIELLEATHYLRNGPDGSGESDGNPEEVRIDRYSALEGTQQIVVSSLFGLTIQCAKCHDHKFEAIPQKDYFRLQAVLYPVFNLEDWKAPKDRFVFASLPGEIERWLADNNRIDAGIAAVRAERQNWQRTARPKLAVLFEDQFDGPPESFAANWSNTAPGDDAPGGTAVVTLLAATEANSTATAPAAIRKGGVLRIVEGGAGGDKWVVTKWAFDWTPDKPGDWIQATFDLVDRQLDSQGTPAARIGYFIAAHDFNDNGSIPGGNLLLDGIPEGGAAVHFDYPGPDDKHLGQIGSTGYLAAKNVGVRVTNIGNGNYRLEQLADWQAEVPAIELKEVDLPNGAFGFEFCCSRSFIVDNVVVESSQGRPDAIPAEQAALREFAAKLESSRKEQTQKVKDFEAQRRPQPGQIAWASDLKPEAPVVRLLTRGNPTTPGETVSPGVLTVVDDANGELILPASLVANRTTGRRLALAQWATQPDSRAAALMARVQVNRVWQQHFGRALATTSDNLGVSGSPPSHPELLEWLAAEFVRSDWSLKSLHRAIVSSSTYRQSSALSDAARTGDADNRWLSRFPLRRLDAEALRDSLLSVSGELQPRFGGAYTPTNRTGTGEVAISEEHVGAHRRSVYLQQKRTQVLSLLNLFDAPSLTFNCTQRPTTTMPLQSLTLLNSDFASARGRALNARVVAEVSNDEPQRISRLFEIAIGRPPTVAEAAAAREFVAQQSLEYSNARDRAWSDLAQMILASNAFLYVE